MSDTLIKDALYYTRKDSGASVEKARGVVIGVVSTLMSQGESFQQAMTTVWGNKRDGYYGELHDNDLGRVIEIMEGEGA